MGQVTVKVRNIGKYNDALELATTLGLKVVDVAITGKWKDTGGAKYFPERGIDEQPLHALHWIGQKWVYMDTDHGLKKCKPGPDGRICLTLTDE